MSRYKTVDNLPFHSRLTLWKDFLYKNNNSIYTGTWIDIKINILWQISLRYSAGFPIKTEITVSKTYRLLHTENRVQQYGLDSYYSG